MSTVLYFFFSGIEWLALILLTFAMFKFQLRGYWGQILLTSALMSLISHFVFQVLEMRGLATLLQPPIIFLFLWQMFRVHIFYASLMTVYGYLGYTFIQMSVIGSATLVGVQLNNLSPNTPLMYTLQSISICLALIAAWLLYRFRIGFTFVPDYEHVSVSMEGLNLRLLFLIFAGYGSLAITNFVAFSSSVSMLFISLISLVLGILLYYAQRKEYAND